MSNKFYQPGEKRAAKVDDLFATIAPRYDLINDLQSFGLHRSWKRKLVNLAQLKSGQRAVDLCCGTGDISFLLAQAGAEVTGLDFSAAMLAVAQKRVAAISWSDSDDPGRTANLAVFGGNLPANRTNDQAGAFSASHTSSVDGQVARQNGLVARSTRISTDSHRSPPDFLRGDAQNLPFPDSYFNVVTVGYGLRNLTNWERGLEEMWRVAKPGGRLLVLDFGKPDNALWRNLYFAYLRFFVPVFGKIFCGDSQTHAYILESLKNYPAQHGVAKKMKSLGCSNVKIVNLLGGVMTINYGEKR
jgi:demethylmenaquinone methyltransferase/2-methoxy-6-polyprenyl-1,4-benzoquinol methylase